MSFLKSVLKSRNVNDGFMDSQLKAWRSSSCSQARTKIDLEDLFISWRSTEAKVHPEVQKVTTKVDSHYEICGQRKTTEEE
ncbi:nuclear pore complex-interacting protein family member A5-like [Callithrix jacchus]|uniref:nuclear pore complex-interacting protein family member B7-like n=1 Tax=Callithrix jacchus TaxID=9483 RepID=UPI00159F6ED7|nr:nuclear pore complex-interacting protein family member B7-like [Callithrix jacchus]